MGSGEGYADIIKSVYPTLIFGLQKSGSFTYGVKDETTIGVFGYDIPLSRESVFAVSSWAYHTA